MRETHPEVLHFMRARRSVPAKAMGGPGPGKAEIWEMLEIASRVPDHGKIAPWRFIVYGDGAKNRLAGLLEERAAALHQDISQEQREVERTRFSRAPAVIGLVSAPRDHPKVPEWEQILSCGAAGMNLLIAANASGYDAQWLTEWYAFDEVLAPHLGLRDGERFAGFIHIGIRTLPKTERDRPSLDDILTIME